MTNENVLITGGSGLLGSHLIPYLQSQKKIVNVLGRKKMNNTSSFLWDIDKQTIDEDSLINTGTIIHLAGASISGKRWTKSYKREILDSRVKSADLLFKTLKETKNAVHTYISASAIGYYGDSGDIWVEETFKAPENFLEKTCMEWENSARQFENIGIRVVIFRIGLVLDKRGGVLPSLALPVKFFIGSTLGSGKQYMSWIHLEDLCRLFSFAIEYKKIHGVYNAVAPNPVPHSSFIKLVGEVLNRPIWPINVPAFILRIILGEKAAIVLEGQRVSSEKIRLAGFHFNHTDLKKTLEEML